ncbi:G-D-S-L family lipolytic protein [Winogradskyella sp.]|uniref:G-D-S-L family lipolytic protein n=1 Tax=Winogradskyella sp. TaxID=1883156 RepID=UPI00262CF0FF|nr:G-D-S-L family lipolytic protein [Winogradskyella sp.]
MKTFKYILLSFLAIGFMACENETLDDLRDIRGNNEEPVVLDPFTAGSLDVSNYVSIGNSLTAGFSDNALYRVSQENSTPAILAQQFATLANGGSFSQPLMDDNIGGLLFGGTQILPPRFYFYADQVSDEESCPYPDPDNSGPSVLGVNPEDPSSTPLVPTTDIVSNPTGPFNNLGVPGAKSFHLLAPGYGDPAGVIPQTANPYFVRMASSPGTTVLADAVAQQPSFISLWIGNNDVLGYALSGGDGTDPITPLAGAPGVGFEATYQAIVGTIVGNVPGVQGILANIPNVTAIPHFTAVPFNALDPCNPQIAPQIPVLNAQLYEPLDNVFTAFGEPDRINPLSSTEANPVLINDEDATDRTAEITAALTPVLGPETAAAFGAIFGKARQATNSDLLVLTASSAIGSTVATAPPPVNVRGISFPLEDNWVLLPSEQMEIEDAITGFNTVIETVASANGFALLDANALLDQLALIGIQTSGLVLTSDLVTGGAFSLDGVHPNSRGYALIANEMLKAIDLAYGSNFEASGNLVDVSTYNTNYSPFLQ